MAPIIAGMTKFINHSIIVVAKMPKSLSVYGFRKNNATFPRNPISNKSIENGLMVCIKNMALINTKPSVSGTCTPKKRSNNINWRQ